MTNDILLKSILFREQQNTGFDCCLQVSSVAGLCGPVGQSGDNKTTHVACHEHHPQPLDCFSSCEGKGRQNSPEASRCGIGDILNSDSSGVQLNWQSK